MGTALSPSTTNRDQAAPAFDKASLGTSNAFCLVVVDKAAEKVREIGGHIDRGPMEGDFAPGYYYFVFEDPDGLCVAVLFGERPYNDMCLSHFHLK